MNYYTEPGKNREKDCINLVNLSPQYVMTQLLRCGIRVKESARGSHHNRRYSLIYIIENVVSFYIDNYTRQDLTQFINEIFQRLDLKQHRGNYTISYFPTVKVGLAELDVKQLRDLLDGIELRNLAPERMPAIKDGQYAASYNRLYRQAEKNAEEARKHGGNAVYIPLTRYVGDYAI